MNLWIPAIIFTIQLYGNISSVNAACKVLFREPSSIDIFLLSEGCQDKTVVPGKCDTAKSKIEINGNDVSPHLSGVNVAIIDYNTGLLKSVRNFRSPDPPIVMLFMRLIGRASLDSIIAVVVQGDDAHALSFIGNELKSIGGSNTDLDYVSSYALLGFNGNFNVSWKTEDYNMRGKGPSVIRKTIQLSSRFRPTVQDDCKVTRKGTEFRGALSTTTSGETCQAWASQTPHIHFGIEKAPDAGLAQNYCRNPGHRSKGPWCYTMNITKIWEYCPVSLCLTSDCCNQVHTRSKGIVHSPNYPGNYTNNRNCSFLLTNSNYRARISITFTHFYVESHLQCGHDSVKIYDGDSTNSTQMGNATGYCGISLPPNMTSTGNSILIVFVSDGNFTFSGFSLYYNVTTLPITNYTTPKPSVTTLPMTNYTTTPKPSGLPYWIYIIIIGAQTLGIFILLLFVYKFKHRQTEKRVQEMNSLEMVEREQNPIGNDPNQGNYQSLLAGEDDEMRNPMRNRPPLSPPDSTLPASSDKERRNPMKNRPLPLPNSTLPAGPVYGNM